MAILLGLLAPWRSSSAAPPNFILILADDLGYGDLACYGHPTHRTPNLDRLAKEGIRFTDFYAAGAQCTPSRAGMLTGRYPVRFGLTFSLMTNAGAGIPDTEILLPELLRKQGYATMLAGKWHLGDQPEYHPRRRGFDRFAGLLRGHDTDPREFFEDDNVVDKEAPVATLTHRYTAAATDFIAASAKKKQPFFLMLAHTYPHVPLAGTYAQAVEEIDASTGALLAALKDHGLDNDTLIFVSSDNGPDPKQGGSTAGLRAAKFSTYEGGVRVPAIAWHPKRIKPKTEPQPAILLDVFPTMLSIAGGKPPSRPLDGQDLSPVLFESGKRNGQDLFFYFRDQLQAHRSGPWKLHVTPDAAPTLYDLSKDPAESTDLSKAHPDLVRQLQQNMRQHQKQLTIDH